MLKSGVAATTVQEGGTVDIVANGNVIGRVTYVDNELTYEDFECDDEDV